MAYRITAWDRAAFKRCRRAWDLGATERQNREPVEPPRTLDFAAALREALAVYYFPGMWAWDRSIVRPLAVEAYLDAVRRQQALVRDLGADETTAWAEQIPLAGRDSSDSRIVWRQSAGRSPSTARDRRGRGSRSNCRSLRFEVPRQRLPCARSARLSLTADG